MKKLFEKGIATSKTNPSILSFGFFSKAIFVWKDL